MVNKSNNGNAHVIVIIALVVTLIGSLGYILWDKVYNKPIQSTTTTATDQSSTVASSSSKTSTEPGIINDADKASLNKAFLSVYPEGALNFDNLNSDIQSGSGYYSITVNKNNYLNVSVPASGNTASETSGFAALFFKKPTAEDWTYLRGTQSDSLPECSVYNTPDKIIYGGDGICDNNGTEIPISSL